jgi:hypothetical protein
MEALETFTLRSGGYWTRPAGALGSIGWSPFPWEITYGATPSASVANFKRRHPKGQWHQSVTV